MRASPLQPPSANDQTAHRGLTRRRFLKSSTLGAASLAAAPALGAAAAGRPPNFLFILVDQHGLHALSSHGCTDVHTPNLDRLVRRGTTFMESHSTNPVCSPARSSLFTGRMPVETGVITNTRPIHPSRPNSGQWLGENGYDCVYAGKWHLPGGRPTRIPGFRVLPSGGGQGDMVDTLVSRASAGYLLDRKGDKPFFLVSSLLQPHDICYWAIMNRTLVPPDLPFGRLRETLPGLPPNNRVRPEAPAKLDRIKGPDFSDEQWRYYRYIYYRQVEMLDADVGRILDALEESGHADNTVVIFTADHGEGCGRHSHVQKWYPYEEAVKVPLIVSWPGRIRENHRDETHLVSGLDVISTMCDYAGVKPPQGVHGRSLRPLLENRPVEWREFVVAETHIIGRMLRTDRYKYVKYEDDPVEQLFDMKNDPWETKNLYREARLANVLTDHRRMLTAWQDRMDVIEPTRVGHRYY